MKCSDINIRDPFVVFEDGIFYMYGTRAANFGNRTGGVDVYTSEDMETWSDPIPCFDSVRFGMNRGVNWAPEVHVYKGAYYMLATFTRECGLHGTYILRADSPLGPFVPHGDKELTPAEWECLDGTLYVSPAGTPYLVFCHEHTQISDGTICYVELSDDLTHAVSEPVLLFRASESGWAESIPFGGGRNYVTDGPFMYRSESGEQFMIWSSFINGRYVVLPVKFADGRLGSEFEHQEPIITDDGGHGMIFRAEDRLYLTFHTPNASGSEHPCFVKIEDMGDRLVRR
ncbi:MAG: family 43 glycosylhydrolase [Clostridia bacterium]|nr:family 43 glycosylhydrolase [Clostridia bacterium]